MGENVFLAITIALPVGLGVLLHLLFGRLGLHRRRTVLALAAGNLAVLFFIGSLVLLAGEGYYRFVYDDTDSFGLTKTTKRWFRRHYANNPAGFRDSVRYYVEPRPGTRRLTFLGDSFTVGHGVPDVRDRFVDLVRHARPELDIQMIARNGMETYQQLEFVLSAMNSDYRWDVAVLVYTLNDISDLVPGWSERLERILSAPEPLPARHSYFLNTLYYRHRARRDPEVSRYYEFVLDAYAGATWQQQRLRLTTLRDEIRARGGQLLAVTFPFLHALGEDYRFSPAHERLDELWRELGVPHLDLLEVYRGRPPRALVVNRYDAHPNENAHRIAAEAIVAFLDRSLELP